MKKNVFKYAVKPFLPLVAFYWFVFRPTATTVKCVVRWESKILLIKNAYGPDIWTLPGGGVKKNELLEDAVIREVREETGVTITNPQKCGSTFYTDEYKKSTVWVFVADVETGNLHTDSAEIECAEWFNQQELPKKKSHLLTLFLQLAGSA